MNRLPPEILSRIAWLVRGYAIDAKPVVPLTHVCRYWRESIVTTPGNWTSISSGSVRLAELCLERCQETPLELSLVMYDVGENSEFTALIMPYMQNTETLRIRRISTIGELVRRLPDLPQSIPNLRTLSLSSDHDIARQDVLADPFGQSTLALRVLSLASLPLFPSLQRLTTLTNLTLHCRGLDLPIDTLLDFLEANRALENVTLDLTLSTFQNSRRRVGAVNHLQSLSTCSSDAAEINAFISRIPLQRGARLEIDLGGQNAGLSEVMSGIPVTHFLNLQSPTSSEYCPDDRSIELSGPNGSFLFKCDPHRTAPFAGFPIFQLTNIKVFHLTRRASGLMDVQTRIKFPPYALPALETLTIKHELDALHLLSASLTDPSASPSLKTLAFLDCRLDGACIKRLTKFASDRKTTTSSWLYRVVIVTSGGNFPSVSSIDSLADHVPVVDVRMGKKLPADLF